MHKYCNYGEWRKIFLFFFFIIRDVRFLLLLIRSNIVSTEAIVSRSIGNQLQLRWKQNLANAESKCIDKISKAAY